MTRKADYVYKNRGGTIYRPDMIRVRVFKRATGRWDVDAFLRGVLRNTVTIRTYSADAGDDFPTKKEALAWADDRYGDLEPINVDNVTDGWPAETPLEKTKDADIEIKPGQIWRFGTRRLVVDWYKPHWNRTRSEVSPMEVGCHFVDPSGRERGRTIVGRRSARQRYGEHSFRMKFRYVPEDK